MWSRLVAAFARLGFAWARTRLDDEARRELHEHLELLTDRYIRSGMSRQEAETAARRQFGNTALVREEIYRMNGIRWVDAIRQDLRYAVRQLRHAPVFAIVVVATLALGIGGTTAVFSVVQGVLLAPLPYDSPGQLVRVYQQEPGNPGSRHFVTGVHFKVLRDEATCFGEIAALDNYSETSVDLVEDGRAERIRVLRVTSGYFRMLRSGPLYGPGFTREDETGARRVVLSDALWRRRFNGDLSLVGSTIRLNALPFEVVGIAPPAFEDPVVGPVDAWLPYDLEGNTGRGNYSLTAIGRLRAGVTARQANAELAAMTTADQARWGDVRRSSVVALPLKDDLVSGSRRPLQLLLAAVALMLLVACVNVANLVLVRATGRVHEFAVRAALGSSVSRLTTQLLTEGAVLAALGGALGIVVARVGVDALHRVGADALPRLQHVGFNTVVLAFAAIVTAATAVVFAVLPALRLARIPPNDALRQQSRSATGTRAQRRMRSALAAAQLALALTLLVGAGALIASFHRLQQVDLGFRTRGVLTFEIGLPGVRYDAAKRAVFHEELSRRLEAIPGVTAAGGASRLPATGSYHPWMARILTGPRAGSTISRSRGLNLQNRTISGRFFEALAIPLLAGRPFDDRDDAEAPGRAVVSASFAREAFPGLPFDSVIGQRIAPLGRDRDIIGVVGDVTLDVYGASALVVYHAHGQFAANRNWTLTQVVATELPPEQVLPSVRAVVAALDPELVVHRPMPIAEVVGRGVARERFALVLMASFAAVALLLAVLGLYGVLAYTVRQRTQEIGIRIALGATAGQVRALVLRQAAGVIVIGLGAGFGGALALGRWLSSLLFQVSPTDARILLATALVLSAASVISAWLPARRAARLEPRLTMQAG